MDILEQKQQLVAVVKVIQKDFKNTNPKFQNSENLISPELTGLDDTTQIPEALPENQAPSHPQIEEQKDEI